MQINSIKWQLVIKAKKRQSDISSPSKQDKTFLIGKKKQSGGEHPFLQNPAF